MPFALFKTSYRERMIWVTICVWSSSAIGTTNFVKGRGAKTKVKRHGGGILGHMQVKPVYLIEEMDNSSMVILG